MNSHRIITLVALCAAWPAAVRADIAVRFAPQSSIVQLGDTFVVDIVADVPANEPVLAWGLDLTIDTPTIASLNGAPTVGPTWMGLSGLDGDGLTGLSSPFVNSFGSVSGTGVLLATLSFTADSVGQTDLFLGTTTGDLTEGFALDPFGFGTLSFETGSITVIPVPGAIAMAVLGFATIAGLRQRV